MQTLCYKTTDVEGQAAFSVALIRPMKLDVS